MYKILVVYNISFIFIPKSYRPLLTIHKPFIAFRTFFFGFGFAVKSPTEMRSSAPKGAAPSFFRHQIGDGHHDTAKMQQKRFGFGIDHGFRISNVPSIS